MAFAPQLHETWRTQGTGSLSALCSCEARTHACNQLQGSHPRGHGACHQHAISMPSACHQEGRDPRGRRACLRPGSRDEPSPFLTLSGPSCFASRHGSYYLIQGVGCALVVCLQLFALGDSILVWGPTVVALIMQSSIFVMLCYYRYCSAVAGGATSRAGTDPLLVVQEPAQAATAQAATPSAVPWKGTAEGR